MTDEFNEERARDFTINCLKVAAQTLKANRDLVHQILTEELGCPDETMADAFIIRTQLLLGFVAGRVSTGALMDATLKPAADGEALH